jgi:O-antigen/teichoic acid export membrane protein
MANPTSAPSDVLADRIPLKQRVIAASAWSLAGYAVSQAIRFGSNLVMTRLLVPEMFGVMAIATVVMVGLAMFSDLGLRQSIVQSRRGDDPAFLNTAWALQILRGLVLWGMALLVALGLHLAGRAGLVPAGSVYADPSLPWVVAALSFGTVIGGLGSTKTFQASRNLALGRLTQIELAAQVAGFAVMLAWASFDRSAWALVAGALAASAVSAAASHRWLTGTPNRWQWDSAALTELVQFGKWIFASSILGFVVLNSDRLLLGAMFDSVTFGISVVAFLMFSAVELVVARIIAGVAFPALSEIARANGDLRAAYYRFHPIIAGAAYFAAAFLVTAGPALVTILYDHRYWDAGEMLRILATALLLLPFQLAVQTFMALGMPQVASQILTVRLIGLYVASPAGFYFFAVTGALWGIVLSQLLYLPLLIYHAAKWNLLSLHKELMVLPALLVGGGIGLVLSLLSLR